MEKILICTRLFGSSYLVENPLKDIRVSISPSIIELSLAPKTKYDFSISLTNLSASILKVKSSVSSFIFEENGTLVILDEPNKWSCRDWIILEDKSFNVPPRDTYGIKGRILVPFDVSGGRYSAITFDINSGEGISRSMMVKIKTGTLVFISIPPTEIKRLTLESFTIEKNTSEEVIFIYSIEESGKYIFEVRRKYKYKGY